MFDWANSFLTGFDAEGATVLGAGISALLIGIATGLRGMRKGRPTQATVKEAAASISQMSCGAPEIEEIVRKILEENRLALDRQQEIERKLSQMNTTLAILQDRMTR